MAKYNWKSCLYKWLRSLCHTYNFILSDIPSLERANRKLKNSLGERADLKGQPHDFREQLKIMNSGTLQHFLLLIFCDTI